MRNQNPFANEIDGLSSIGNDAGLATADQPDRIESITRAAVDELVPGRYQPRRRTSDEGLAELAQSMVEQGVLQPIVVRPMPQQADASPGKRYEIVAGERRWRAARLAGLPTVPVMVREFDDQSALAVALIENLQREDLNPIDQAYSLSRLSDEFALTHEQVAKAVGRSRSSVSNLLRLLGLADEVKALVEDGKIDMGHARALLPLDAIRQEQVARRIHARGLSVRQVEKTVKEMLVVPDESTAKPGVDAQTRWLQEQLAAELGSKLSIRPDKDGGYVMQIRFGSLRQLRHGLERVLALITGILDTAGPRVRDGFRKPPA